MTKLSAIGRRSVSSEHRVLGPCPYGGLWGHGWQHWTAERARAHARSMLDGSPWVGIERRIVEAEGRRYRGPRGAMSRPTDPSAPYAPPKRVTDARALGWPKARKLCRRADLAEGRCPEPELALE